MAHIDEFLEEYEPRRMEVEILTDGALAADVKQLMAEREEASRSNGSLKDPADEELERRLEEVRQRVDANTRTFVFESIGDLAWEKLVKEHPPTDEQKKDMRWLDWNIETFPHAAVAVSIVEPEGVDEEKLTAVRGKITQYQWQRLWQAAMEVNSTGDELGKDGIVTALMSATGSRSTTAPQEGSPALSSSDG